MLGPCCGGSCSPCPPPCPQAGTADAFLAARPSAARWRIVSALVGVLRTERYGRVTFAGIRTALAVNVGTAPLAFLIGGGGLGELIFTGIDLNEPGMMLAGAIPTALLAVVVDYAVGAVTYFVVPRGVNPLR